MINKKAKVNNSNRKVRVLTLLVSNISYLIVAIIIIINAIIYLPGIFGYQVYHVVSGSMEPELKTNSIIFVQEVAIDQLKPGNIVTYDSQGIFVTHRIVEINEDQKTIITKGDANKEVDFNPVSMSDIAGIVVLSIPYLGFYMSLISHLLGKVVVILIVIILLYLGDTFRFKEV